MKLQNNMKLKAVRGTHDLFGKEIEKYNKIKNIISEMAKLSSFNELATPIFESTEVFLKPLGDHSDVVLKEMYTFEDKNKELLTLRPEYTTSMIRAAITNNLLSEIPLKIFGIGPMFRRERPQKGRYRQFNQINFEILGSNDILADVELISIADEFLKKILPNCKIKLNINSLGTKKDLKNYTNKLTKFFNSKKSLLSDDSRKKIDLNPLRILDSKHLEDIEISKQAPLIYEFLSSEIKNNYEELKNILKSININFVENNNLVRGLDYYCSTVFEFKTSELGSQDTLIGGGRYDGLIGLLGGQDIPGIGWAGGIERIAMLMEYNQKNNKDVHIAVLDKNYKMHLAKLLEYLKIHEISYFWDFKYNLKKSLSKANKENATYVIIIGSDESEGNYYTIKNLLTADQKKLEIDKISRYLNVKS